MINWIKLDINILDDAKIKIIRSHPNGDAVFVLWVGLLCLAMKSQRPGTIEITDGLPYTVDDLANLFGIEKKTVEMGIALFVKYRMVEIFEGGAIEVINFSKHQKLEDIQYKNELTKIRMQKYRERKAIGYAPVTRNGVTVTSTDKDIDLDKDKEKHICAKAPFIKPSLDEVTEYCRERQNSVDPEAWFNHYTSNGWKVGKNKMVDWRAAVRTWEKGREKSGMVTV